MTELKRFDVTGIRSGHPGVRPLKASSAVTTEAWTTHSSTYGMAVTDCQFRHPQGEFRPT
jgi:hypothetical protein